MKNPFFPAAVLFLVFAQTLSLISCQEDSSIRPEANNSSELSLRSNANNALYPPTAQPFGKSYEEWIISANARSTAFDCSVQNPNTLNQNDPHVFYLSAPLGTATINVTVPKEKAIFSGVVSYLNDWPCPDPNWQPAPGQSMEDFLQEGATAAIDAWTVVAVTLDGVALDLEDYRFLTDLFYFTGNPDLSNCFDPCITGTPQPAVIDGYHIMIKKLNPGLHTLVISGEIPGIWSFENTFNLTVE